MLYQAYYDGGIRVVDVSGELMGNLYDQGREIAVFKPYDPKGFTANAPFVMNAMPWKGNVLFTDFNSGLWAAKLEPKRIVPCGFKGVSRGGAEKSTKGRGENPKNSKILRAPSSPAYA